MGANSSRRHVTIRKSETGQAQIITAILFLALISTGAVIAQNASTSIANISAEAVFLSNTTSSANTNAFLHNESNATPEANEKLAANITEPLNKPINKDPVNNIGTGLESPDNSTNASRTGREVFFNVTSENQTNFTANATEESFDTNRTQNRTSSRQHEGNASVAIPFPGEGEHDAGKAHLVITLSSPRKMVRGEAQQLLCVIENNGSGTARMVRGAWILPEGFDVQGELRFSCGNLAPKSACSSTINATPSMNSETGKDKIMVVVKYNE